MKTYTPDEYRQMAANQQFGKGFTDCVDSRLYGWLVGIVPSGTTRLFVIRLARNIADFVVLSEDFVPCEEPKELQG